MFRPKISAILWRYHKNIKGKTDRIKQHTSPHNMEQTWIHDINIRNNKILKFRVLSTGEKWQ